MTNQDNIITPSSEFLPPEAELADFWSRLGAHVLDAILYGLVALPFAAIGGAVIFSQTDALTTASDDVEFIGNPFLGFAGGLTMLLGGLLALGLFIHALSTTGQPWGARVVGLRVVGGDGQPIGVGRALLRTLVSGAGAGKVCFIGYLWMLGNPERQTWQDKIARSYVIRD